MKDTDIKQLVGLKVKKFRQKNKLTQFELGELININQRQIAQIECGKSFPSLQTLLKLSKVLQHDVSSFFEVNTEMPEKILKNTLISKIKKADYNDCKRLLCIIEEFTDI